MQVPQSTLRQDEIAALREAIASDGTVRVARWIGIARDSLGRAVAGLPVQRGTIALIRLRTGAAAHKSGAVS